MPSIQNIIEAKDEADQKKDFDQAGSSPYSRHGSRALHCPTFITVPIYSLGTSVVVGSRQFVHDQRKSTSPLG
jgi:hypothetical protein